MRQFEIMENLSDEQLDLLTTSLSLHYAAKGQRILERGSTDTTTLFLVSGTLLLEAADGHTTTIVADTPSARRPIAQLTPKQYDVTAKSPVEYLLVDCMVLQDLQRHASTPSTPGMVLTGETLVGEESENGLFDRIQEDLERDHLLLPSLPEIAIRIGRALEDESTDAKRISRMIQSDPAITAKLIKAANSALFLGREPVDKPSAAVVRLGIDTTHKLVVGFALGELFRARSKTLQQRMKTLWEHSIQVAAISFVLARLSKQFHGEQAMLAGLTHDVGTIAILSYAEQFPEVVENPGLLDDTIKALRGTVGGMILRKWNFPEELVVAAEEGEDWHRDKSPQPDYADLVIIAQLHSFVGTPMMEQAPHLGEVPCFQKLNLGELTPQKSLKILEKAEDQVKKARALLGV